MNKITTFATIDTAVSEIMNKYIMGFTYVEGKFHNGHNFKIRMNKDHDMKDYNNCSTEHVLSIVYHNKAHQSVSSLFFTNIDGFYRQQVVLHTRRPDMECDYEPVSENRIIPSCELEEAEAALRSFLEMIYEQEPIEEDY